MSQYLQVSTHVQAAIDACTFLKYVIQAQALVDKSIQQSVLFAGRAKIGQECNTKKPHFELGARVEHMLLYENHPRSAVEMSSNVCIITH